MIGLRQKIYQEARRQFDDGNVEQAELSLRQLWDEYPYDESVFQLLLEIYKSQKQWNAAEMLILQHEKNGGYQPVVNERFLDLYLTIGDAEKAWEKAEKAIAEAPDFTEGISEIGHKFSFAGQGEVFLRKIADSTIPGLQKHVIMAAYHYSNNAYETAISLLEEALLHNPEDESAQYALKCYQGDLKNQKKNLARSILADNAEGDYVKAYQQVYQLNPQSIVSQEYYLSALACKFFPPFRIYFHGNNFVGVLPYGGKAVIFIVFFLICSIYYRNGIMSGERDHLQSVIYLFSVLVIPRYLIFPLVVQLLSFKYVPGFHLLKRPTHFLNGSIILATWMQIFVLSYRAPTNGLDHFLAACMMVYVLGFSLANNERFQYKKWTFGYGLVAITLGLLAYFKIIYDIFLFSLIAGWIPPLLALAFLGYLQKLKDASMELKEKPPVLADEKNQKSPKITFIIHILSLILSIVGVVLFLASKNIFIYKKIPLLFLAFPMIMHSITVLSFTEPNGKSPDWGWLFQNKPAFRFFFVLFSVGMYAGSIFLGTKGNVPFRESRELIPVVALFFASWGMLFYLTYYFRDRSTSTM